MRGSQQTLNLTCPSPSPHAFCLEHNYHNRCVGVAAKAAMQILLRITRTLHMVQRVVSKAARFPPSRLCNSSRSLRKTGLSAVLRRQKDAPLWLTSPHANFIASLWTMNKLPTSDTISPQLSSLHSWLSATTSSTVPAFAYHRVSQLVRILSLSVHKFH